MTAALVHSRKCKRYEVSLPVIFSWEDAQGFRHEQSGVTRDLSVRGAFVFATNPPPLGAHIKLKGYLPPGGRVMQVRIFGEGKVVCVEPALGSHTAGFTIAGGPITFRRWAKG
jgi:hypothetical protein